MHGPMAVPGGHVATATESGTSFGASGDASALVGARLRTVIATWSHCQARIIELAAQFADGGEWVLDGSPTAAHWIADVADIETCTAREWIRIGRKLEVLPATATAFSNGEVSYSKVRTITRIATADNEAELLDIAYQSSASDLGRAIAGWMHQTKEPEEIASYQHGQRSVQWRNEPDGMVLFTLRLPPWVAAKLIAILTKLLMTSRIRGASADRPTVAQQHADHIDQLLEDGTGQIDTEIVIHVRGDGCTFDDGIPIPASVVESIADNAFISALIHDSQNRPIDATNRRRHPTRRQKRLVKERDIGCVDCGRRDLLEYDHNPPHPQTRHTITTELELRCAPCHDQRQPPPQWARRQQR